MESNVIWPAAGRYVLAVSGGMDSMTLLDLMAKVAADRGYELIVAHYDHGIRADSAQDAQLVRAASGRYGLTVEIDQGNLGQASEAVARSARHAFLEQIRSKHAADAIITAHHQDDLIETSLLNLTRGTGRRGLAPLGQTSIIRPLLDVSRAQILAHATSHHITWREDSTNANLANPRNFLRRELLPLADQAWRSQYLALIGEVRTLSAAIDHHLSSLISRDGDMVVIDHQTSREASLAELEELIILVATSLDPALELDHRLVQELALFAKTGRSGKHRPLNEKLDLYVSRNGVVVTPRS